MACGGGQGGEAPPLDAAAEEACEAFEPVRRDVRRGELTGPNLYRVLQDVYDQARQSQREDVSGAAQRLLSAAINDDSRAVSQAVTELEQACGLPFA